MVVLVTGANGQLGQAIQSISDKHPKIDFKFCTSSDLDITSKENCQLVFTKFKPNYCINAAAYTAVDKAESEPDKAQLINIIGAKNLAEVCKEFSATLLHVSTDFVFDGSKTTPYLETDIPNPIGVYGKTKLDGEKAIQETFDNYFIIRTSWVYSQFGNNFMKTMLRLASERDSLSVVSDQIGTPTHAVDLAEVLIKIISSCHSELVSESHFGIYNYSNKGQCSWYDFAKKIFEVNNISINLQPIPTTSFPTPAKRPAYSVLDKSKIKNVFGLEINNWEESLKKK
ncbi:dTDP-4-dehydrorhamnose reductase [Flavobacterium aquatile]|uniref:dTDP-4-dehydrorhamnose reductase n=1 Tax=Flavobacterium aquatile LMG 4008 = ATCC 11947 TaxID=1453498 RepID=A0A095SVZ5_9FLAO|nr:dTDP-4-dehydrorhamnose reductase [Flavobacterium aquatile]KGD68772.1 dTDP-4-dehydrorhamnose reductase [Flavobacterium aquatile LMG 4008 = ATCC 11947]OXA69191.1 NAD(P)-dependent oxidoreductase [Flavobacterium aquatile LMG 4008 = ATCC 11947]GEC79058.1 NAD(P)-dependent oxidoreductase [Flavobacterium aquatile]